jgi:hypothetical protein
MFSLNTKDVYMGLMLLQEKYHKALGEAPAKSPMDVLENQLSMDALENQLPEDVLENQTEGLTLKPTVEEIPAPTNTMNVLENQLSVNVPENQTEELTMAEVLAATADHSCDLSVTCDQSIVTDSSYMSAKDEFECNPDNSENNDVIIFNDNDNNNDNDNDNDNDVIITMAVNNNVQDHTDFMSGPGEPDLEPDEVNESNKLHIISIYVNINHHTKVAITKIRALFCKYEGFPVEGLLFATVALKRKEIQNFIKTFNPGSKLSRSQTWCPGT